jgi:hypothetical protein
MTIVLTASVSFKGTTNEEQIYQNKDIHSELKLTDNKQPLPPRFPK